MPGVRRGRRRDILSPRQPFLPELPPWDESRVTDADEEVVISHNWAELRRFMWDYVGIVRTTKRLQRAQHRIRLLAREIHEYYSNFRISNDLIELRNLVVTADSDRAWSSSPACWHGRRSSAWRPGFRQHRPAASTCRAH
jgi:aspartate oxidase